MPVAWSKGYTSSARLAVPVSAYQSIQSGDFGVTQPAIPTLATATSAVWYIQVSSAFRVYKPVQVIRPAQNLDPSGILVGNFQCVAPVDPGRLTAITSASNTYMYIQGFLYLCTTSGTTAAKMPVLNQAAGATTTDGTAVWTSQGRQVLIEAQVYSVKSQSPAVGPTAQEYGLFQQ
jgi:hypothetical protein